jgi:competence protein ComEC
MPLIAVALIAYVAGLLAGFANSYLLAAVAAIAVAAAGMPRGRTVAIGLAALCLAGVIVASACQRDDVRCLNAALHAQPVSLVVEDSIGPGGFGRARLDACDAAVSIAVERGSAPAGSTIAARGDVAQTQRGLLIQHATITAVRASSLLWRWRAATGRGIDATFGEDAPLVRALLIADRRELSPELRDRFAAAGLAHILAIAGLHIGIIALALEIAFQLAGIPRRRAAIATIVTITFYVALIGAPIPAVRAAAMLATLLVSRLAQRPTSRWAIVALGASQPFVAPRVVLDVGYQLSVIGVASMICAGRLGRRIGVNRLPWFPRMVATTMTGTTVATIGSAPIVAWVFGRVSVVAPLSNLAAGPLIALAQPMIFFGMLLAPIAPVARLIADASHPLLVALDRVAATAAAVPAGAITVAPTVSAAVVAGVMSIAVIVACGSREWMKPTLVAVLAAALLIWMPIAPTAQGSVELHMIDVGQGDAIALKTPHAHWILFDAGGAWRGNDAGRSTVIPYIGRRGGSLDMFVLSHPHTDHVGGAASVLRSLHPATYVDAGFPGPADAYRASLDVARASHVRWVRAHPGDRVTIDGVSLEFLAPDSVWTSSLNDPNLASVITLVQYGDVRMLMMGDAERPEEDWLLAHQAGELHADILKVGHHGSQTSSSEAFLTAVKPRLALVSVGAGNKYGLPTPAIMDRLAAGGAQVLRTDRLGTIVASTDGHRVFVEAAGDTWELLRR